VIPFLILPQYTERSENRKVSDEKEGFATFSAKLLNNGTTPASVTHLLPMIPNPRDHLGARASGLRPIICGQTPSFGASS
jgi:hypothetical protein